MRRVSRHWDNGSDFEAFSESVQRSEYPARLIMLKNRTNHCKRGVDLQVGFVHSDDYLRSDLLWISQFREKKRLRWRVRHIISNVGFLVQLLF